MTSQQPHRATLNTASAPAGAPILVIAAHPALRDSQVTRALMQAVQQMTAVDAAASSDANPSTSAGTTPEASHETSHKVNPGAAITVRDLYALYPDYLIDVPAEQAALAAARLVVWLHPVHWYSMPPLLKLWLDECLSFGWAYGPGGQALRGKDLWLVASTGGPEDSYHPAGYNRYFFDAYLPPYEQTARLCGMRWLPPLVLHGAHQISPAERQAHAALFTQRLHTWPQWPELVELEADLACQVPTGARPAST